MNTPLHFHLGIVLVLAYAAIGGAWLLIMLAWLGALMRSNRRRYR